MHLPRLKNWYDTHSSTIYGISSVFGTIITLVYTGISFYNSKWTLEYEIVVLALASIILCLTILFFVINKDYYRFSNEHYELSSSLERKDDCITTTNLAIHNILHESRTWIETFYSQHIDNLGKVIESHKNSNRENLAVDPRDIEHLKHKFDTFMLYVLSNVKSCLDLLTSDNCAACIKVICEMSSKQAIDSDPLQNLTVKTLLRDHMSYRIRHIIDSQLPEYPYYENTAFKTILDKRTRDTYYLSNNLANEKNYQNYREDWKDSYNATLVVPIRKHCGSNTFRTLGFLCVDNFKGGFDVRTKDFLGAIADHLYNVFRIYNDVIESYKFMSDFQTQITAEAI